MSADWYQSLSEQEIRCLLKKEGVRNIEDADRDDLIEILEEIEEEKAAERQQNNDIMRLKGKKYDIFREHIVQEEEECEYQIPEVYADTQISLLLRDPFWAFSFWDINPLDLSRIKEQFSSIELFLRVYELENDYDQVQDALNSFEIPIKESDTSWYVNLPTPGRWYSVDLLCYCCQDASSELYKVASSNTIESPGGYWLNHTKQLKEGSNSLELFLAGITDSYGNIAENPLINEIISSITPKKRRSAGKEDYT